MSAQFRIRLPDHENKVVAAFEGVNSSSAVIAMIVRAVFPESLTEAQRNERIAALVQNRLVVSVDPRTARSFI